ncbi:MULTISPECIES: aminopeptidase P family protein [unclassified Devosia]|uniref:aminopeptidase P family protein n=1 Tax=unclassified Devosia TaxID=196773 RepID=UPI00086F0CF2|nr:MULTISPECIES: aminopeptidase P family protein [unclassified Devosia]MBN9364746.1 aminopeptidase P family protein [Devosia sp.]ODS81734.1 MAG: X-Pro aminopeptidase [Devosia sp. SCN 66-27]OJX25602.1 MAG: X-Pro aminopeptidase [Devosia sp. 66-14]
MASEMNRLAALRAELAGLGIDGVIVPRFDAHQGEYCAPHDERLRYLTRFTGSAGIALVTADSAVIFVDGRYQVQVRQEVDLDAFEISHFYDFPLERWLGDKLPRNQRIGFNPMLIPSDLHERLKAAMQKADGELVALEADPIDAIWPDQPAPPTGRIQHFANAGEAALDKRRRIGARLTELGADFLVETQPDNIAWLLNVRGSDVQYTPLPQSFLLLDRSGETEWFVDERKLPNDREAYELEAVTTRSPADLLGRIAARSGGKRALVDPRFASVAAALAVQGAGGTVLSETSPITIAKAIKNSTELDGFRSSHVSDGVALTEFLSWLHEHVAAREMAGDPITELEAEDKLLAFRARGEGFVEPSFRSISASAANAAMCHYASSEATNAPLTISGVYLIDSGGQYLSGTTDVTRTTAFAPVSVEVRRTYTAVLKGFVALMTAQFPVTARGHHLDALARRPLWDLGLDYDHGTGHGVGHFLSVHEHPQRFGKVVNNYEFAPGVIMTIEPGYYREGEFGLRVENQVETVAAAPGFLRFETLTLAPIDLALADVSALTRDEVAWIDGYHARVRAALVEKLSATARVWLEQMTAPIGSPPP